MQLELAFRSWASFCQGSAASENPFPIDSVPVHTVNCLSEEIEGALEQAFAKILEISKEQMTEKS